MKLLPPKDECRLWLWASLAFFCAAWFFPIIPTKNFPTPIEALSDVLPEFFVSQLIFTVIFLGILSFIVGWFFTCGLKIIRRIAPRVCDRTSKVKKVMALGIFLFLLSGLFPPWIATLKDRPPGVRSKNLQCSDGYTFMFRSTEDNFDTYTVDRKQLLGQWLGLGLSVACGLLYARKNGKVLSLT
jgi:hypothetical protein